MGREKPSVAVKGVDLVQVEVLHKRIRELEMERDMDPMLTHVWRIQKSLGHFQPSDLAEVYGFIRQHTTLWPLHTLCQALQVSRSGYYSWLNRGTSTNRPEQKQEALVVKLFKEHRRRYGVRRLVAELREQQLAAIELGSTAKAWTQGYPAP